MIMIIIINRREEKTYKLQSRFIYYGVYFISVILIFFHFTSLLKKKRKNAMDCERQTDGEINDKTGFFKMK